MLAKLINIAVSKQMNIDDHLVERVVAKRQGHDVIVAYRIAELCSVGTTGYY
jgi:hypothetical protein